jgi:hypothetical protein
LMLRDYIELWNLSIYFFTVCIRFFVCTSEKWVQERAESRFLYVTLHNLCPFIIWWILRYSWFASIIERNCSLCSDGNQPIFLYISQKNGTERWIIWAKLTSPRIITNWLESIRE